MAYVLVSGSTLGVPSLQNDGYFPQSPMLFVRVLLLLRAVILMRSESIPFIFKFFSDGQMTVTHLPLVISNFWDDIFSILCEMVPSHLLHSVLPLLSWFPIAYKSKNIPPKSWMRLVWWLGTHWHRTMKWTLLLTACTRK